eukprot:12867753-Prorocentrum_lima.AAC.1
MTSSLVGSEMCIRDSQRKEHTSQLSLRDATHASLLQIKDGQVHQEAVSYTHLTLPTICSV